MMRRGFSSGRQGEYERDMDLLFEQLSAYAQIPGKIAIYRETSAQHFERTGSYAGPDQARALDPTALSPF